MDLDVDSAIVLQNHSQEAIKQAILQRDNAKITT